MATTTAATATATAYELAIKDMRVKRTPTQPSNGAKGLATTFLVINGSHNNWVKCQTFSLLGQFGPESLGLAKPMC